MNDFGLAVYFGVISAIVVVGGLVLVGLMS
jgi:hypothetical protein